MNSVRTCALIVLSLLCGAVILGGIATGAETGWPMLMSLKPTAVQAGQSIEVAANSRYSLLGAYEVLVTGTGVTGEIVQPPLKPEEYAKVPEVTKLAVRLTAAADALPGVRDVRIATPRGISTVGQLVVVRDPVSAELPAPNDTPAQAQQIALPVAVCGCIEKNEDLDFYKFHVEAGVALTFHVRCNRLENRIHDLQSHADPILTLRSPAGVTIAASDNYFFADPALSYRFEQAGDYLLEIRDVRYEGNQYWEYCIEINDRPLIENVFPLAVAPGQAEKLQPFGQLVPEGAQLDVSLATGPQPGILWQTAPLAGSPSNPFSLLIVADVPLVREADATNDSAETAQPLALPLGVNGRIEREGDVDYYAFEAKKGEAFSFEITSRRLQSSLDSHLRILNDKLQQLQLNDDLRLGKRGSADSWIENWTAPADGKYLIEVRDVHLRGGPAFPYFLKVTRSLPYFELYLDTDKTLVGPGGCGAIFVRTVRKNGFTGEIALSIEGLPHGVTASCGRILADKGEDGCIVLEAEADAFPNVANTIVRGTATHTQPDGTTLNLMAVASPYQETYQPGGGRGHWPVETHAIAVTEYGDLRGITLSTYDIVLKPGESQKIEIKIDRSPEFTANVTLDMLMRHLNSNFATTLPQGVTLDDKAAQSLLAGTATDGFLTVTAAKDAPPLEKQQCVVLGHVALNFVMKWTYASRPVTISVAKAE
jgi:hypothetical protein